MLMYGDEIKVQQGEDFNFDRLLSASSASYVPYIVSSERTRGDREAYFVITVASTKFEKNMRYVCSFWNQINPKGVNSESEYLKGNLPTFYQTVPQETSYTEKNLPSIPNEGEDVHRYLYQYVNEKEKTYEYFWWDNSSGGWKRVDEYECHVRFNFTSNITKDWTGQNYMYQVTLVSGQPMRNRIKSIIESHLLEGDKIDDFPRFDKDEDGNDIVESITLKKQFRYIKARWPYEFQPDIDEDSPLGTIETPEVILQPTKLEVFNNLRKLI